MLTLPKQWFVHLGQRCVDLFFPPTCVGCHRIGYYLCPTCAQEVEVVQPRLCERCRQSHPHESPVCNRCKVELTQSLRSVQSAAYFTHPLQPAIHALKYNNQPELASLLARYLVATFTSSDQSRQHRPDVVIPVPIYQDRLKERGYNQSELLATYFAQSIELPTAPQWLHKVRATRSQVGLNAIERQKNVTNAFQASAHVAGYTVLLIDDVYTTGSTLFACASALSRAGAEDVYALTLATRKQK